MQLDAYRQLGFWTLALGYYARHDPEAMLDPEGDQVVADFIAPLVRQLRDEDLLADYSWMRYAEGGFHLRCQFRAQSEDQAALQQDCIRAHFQRIKLARPALFTGEQRLSPMAAALNRRSGVNTLHAPGTLQAGVARDTGEEHVYDQTSSYLYVMRAHTLWSDVALQAVAATTTYDQRLWISLPAVLALLRQHAACSSQHAAQALFIAATWRQHFGIDATIGDAQAARVWAQRDRIEALAASIGTSPRQTVRHLPENLHHLAEHALAWGQAGVTSLAAERPELRAMQVLSLVHQVFNRLGISLIDETAICALVYRRVATDAAVPVETIQAEVATWIQHWSRPHVAAA